MVYISMCIQTKRHSYRVHVGTSMYSYQVLSVESIQFNEIIRPLQLWIYGVHGHQETIL